MTVLLPLLFVLIGGLAYLLAANPKYQQLGLVTFGCGLLAFLLTGGQQVVSLFQ